MVANRRKGDAHQAGQQPGLTGTSIGNNAITSLEMFSVMANTQALTGHLIGLWVSLWLLQRLARR